METGWSDEIQLKGDKPRRRGPYLDIFMPQINWLEAGFLVYCANVRASEDYTDKFGE